MNRDVCEHFKPVDLPCKKCNSVQKSTLREAAQQALFVLERNYGGRNRTNAITALRAALDKSQGAAMSTSFFDTVLYDGSNKPNTDGFDFSNTKPTGCLPPQKPVMPRWVAVFEEEAKKPLSVIGLNRDDIKQAARDYKLMQDLYESVSNIRDAAVRILAEAQGQETSVLFEPLNLQTLSSCIDHHAAELFRLRAKVHNLEKLLEKKQ